MLEKTTIRPHAAPPVGVRCLSDWLYNVPVENHLQCTRPRCRAWHTVSKPQGARDGDIFVCSEVLMSEQYRHTGIDEGDFLIFMVTDDVKTGDLVSLRWRRQVYTGFLSIESDGRYLLTSADGEPLFGYFSPERTRIIGRAVEAQRDRRRVYLMRQLRPCHADWENVGQIALALLKGVA